MAHSMNMVLWFDPINLAPANPETIDPATFIALVRDHKWAAVMLPVIFLAMRVVQNDIRFFPTIAPKYRIYFLGVLGILSTVVGRVAGGETWVTAAVGAGLAMFGSMYFHEVVVESARNGKNIPIPGLTIPGERPNPIAPATVSVTPTDQILPPNTPPTPPV